MLRAATPQSEVQGGSLAALEVRQVRRGQGKAKAVRSQAAAQKACGGGEEQMADA